MNNLNAEEVFFQDSLYIPHSFTEDDFDTLYYLIFSKDRVDWFCPDCQKETVYKGENESPKKSQSTYEHFTCNELKLDRGMRFFTGKDFQVKFICSREPHLHKVEFILRVQANTLFKIGQFPTYADLSDHKTTRYRNVLGQEKFTEFNKAIGLYSHGIGIGSVIYLRRIFEELIFQTYNLLPDDIKAIKSYKDFRQLRMEEKIEFLKPFLPGFLVENKRIYGLLSKAVHELSEKESLEIFSTGRLGIELILDEKVLQMERAEKVKHYKERFNKANG